MPWHLRQDWAFKLDKVFDFRPIVLVLLLFINKMDKQKQSKALDTVTDKVQEKEFKGEEVSEVF